MATSIILFAISILCLVFGYPYIEGKYIENKKFASEDSEFDQNNLNYGD